MWEHLQTISQFIAACVLAFNCYQSWRNGQRAKTIAANVLVIEKATNSMKDALVAATDKAARSEGTALGLAQGRSEGNTKEPEPVKVEITNMPDLKTLDKK